MKKLLIGGVVLSVLLLGAGECFIGAIAVSDGALSSKMPAIAHFEEAHFPSLPAKRIYASVTIDVPASRKISIFDYQLEIAGKAYGCIALREAGGKWATLVEPQAGGKKYALLFVLDRDVVPAGESIELTLENCGSKMKKEIAFQNLRDQAL